MSPDEPISSDIADTFWAIFVPRSPKERAEYNFRLFEKILMSSPFVFVFDWRSNLKEELDRIGVALNRLGVILHFEYSQDGNIAVVRSETHLGIRISCRPDDESRIHIIDILQRMFPAQIEFREYRPSMGSDTRVFAVLPPQAWLEFRGEAYELLNELFQPYQLHTENASEGRWIPIRKIWCALGEVVAIILLLIHFLALKSISNWVLGPGNIFDDYWRTTGIFFGVLSIIEYEKLTQLIFHYDDDALPWYQSKLLIGGLGLCLLFAAFVESYERMDRRRAQVIDQETRKFNKEIRDKLNDPEVKAGLKAFDEFRKRKEEEKAKADFDAAKPSQ